MSLDRQLVTHAHTMLDRLAKDLGSLDHLCFAFPQVLVEGSQSYEDPSVLVAAAIARAVNPPSGTIASTVDSKHPVPSTYVRLDGVSGLEIEVPTKNAKKLLKRKRCLVIERWRGKKSGDRYVCRVTDEIRDGVGNRTIAVVGIPPRGFDWNLAVVSAMQETAREITAKRQSLSQ